VNAEEGPGFSRRPLHGELELISAATDGGLPHLARGGAYNCRRRHPGQREGWSRNDYYPSIHIEEYESKRADTSSAPEEKSTRALFPTSGGVVAPQPGRERSHPHRRGWMMRSRRHPRRKGTPKGNHATRKKSCSDAISGEKPAMSADRFSYCPPGIEGTVGTSKFFTRKGRGGRTSDTRRPSKTTAGHQYWERTRRRNYDLTDGRLIAPADLLAVRFSRPDLHAEKQQAPADQGVESLAKSSRDLTRTSSAMKLNEKRSSAHRENREVEELTRARSTCSAKSPRRARQSSRRADRTASRRHQAGQGLNRHEGKLSIGDKMAAARQQGRNRPHRARRGMPYMPDGTRSRSF